MKLLLKFIWNVSLFIWMTVGTHVFMNQEYWMKYLAIATLAISAYIFVRIENLLRN